jgi:hypothetical protein
VDKLVKDIYGGDYELCGLPGDTVAARYGTIPLLCHLITVFECNQLRRIINLIEFFVIHPSNFSWDGAATVVFERLAQFIYYV